MSLVVRPWSLARKLSTSTFHLPASAGLNCSLPAFGINLKTKLNLTYRSTSNPMFGAKRLSQNRDTESVVALAPNVGLIYFCCGHGPSGSMPRSILAMRS